MSVVYQNNHGWILDHRLLITAILKDVSDDTKKINFTYNEDLFKIYNPFMMDSKFTARHKPPTDNNNSDPPLNRRERRKRKRKTDLNEGELKAKELHKNIIAIVLPAYKILLDEVKDQGVFRNYTNLKDNNVTARHCAVFLGPGNSLRDFCSTTSSSFEIETVILNSGRFYDNLSNKFICNTENAPIKIRIMDDFYLIPSKSSFVMTDIKNMKCFISHLGRGKFDLILLDPPWENKSNKRQKQYWSLSNDELFEIPVPELSSPGCIIGVWVTNRVKHKDFIIERLFPYWKVNYVATWYWVKVTKSGEMVFDIHSDHKKPYEMLILGVFESSNDIENREQISSEGRPTDSSPIQLNKRKDLPLNKTIVSVPSSIHSMKVPLQEIITPYLPSNPKCLEVFARNLQPGWVSFGNEVYKHQHIDYFEMT